VSRYVKISQTNRNILIIRSRSRTAGKTFARICILVYNLKEAFIKGLTESGSKRRNFFKDHPCNISFIIRMNCMNIHPFMQYIFLFRFLCIEILTCNVIPSSVVKGHGIGDRYIKSFKSKEMWANGLHQKRV